MTLLLHRHDDPAALADQLAELLAEAPLDVFARELIVAPSPGVERWLTQRLSHRLGATRGDDGVCAGLDVRTPRTFISLLLGRESDDPWHPDRLAWAVLAAMDECVGRRGFESLARHLGADALRPGEDPWWHRASSSRRYAVARRLAGLFAGYADERPSLMRAWEQGDDGALLDDDLRWQPMLWRSVLERVLESRSADCSPVARLDRTLEQLRAGLVPDDVPARLSFFGYSRMPTALVDLLEALATVREVHLWLPHPSPGLWQTLAAQDAVEAGARVDIERRHDTSAVSAHHPLLATLGRDVRELEGKLLTRDVVDVTAAQVTAPSSPTVPSTTTGSDVSPATTRLAMLQRDVRANRAPTSEPAVAPNDPSFQVHVCHGAARQVEALRETLLWLVSADGGDLEPRDIIVMCPDVEAYAPLIKATFAAVDEHDHHPGRRLRVQLADRGLAATNPLAETAQRLVELVTSRVTASQVLDFAALPAVAQRFDFDTEKLERIASWVRDTEARWGLDSDHRGEYRLKGLGANTWAQALDRLAMGVAMSADVDAAGADLMPVDDLGSTDIGTASDFVALMTSLTQAAHEIRRTSEVRPDLPRASFTPPEWFTWLRRHVDAVAATAADTMWQRAEFDRELAFLEAGSRDDAALRITDVRVMLEQRWGPRRTRSNFRNGAISICTLTPMRSVPHRAVVLLGLDDDTFPRSHVVDGDDVLARHPLVGERDPRSEDRQLLLDALMAADNYFIAFYSGFDERDGTRRPPAVPLQEVAAAMARTGVGASYDPGQGDGRAPFEHIHPLQAFDERNFTDVSALPGGSYDRAAFDGAQALRAFHADEHPRARPRLLARPLPAAAPTDLTVDDLTRFLQNPAREFLRRRLQVGVTREVQPMADHLPIQLDGLERWAVGDRVLRSVLAGTSLDAAIEQERRRGSLPPAPLTSGAEHIAQQVRGVLSGVPASERESYDVFVDVDLPPGGVSPAASVRVTGTVSGVIGQEIQVITFSTVNANHLAQAWVQVLALAVAHPGRAWSAAVRGKARSCRLVAPPADEARRQLVSLVLNRGYGMRAPLPAPAKTSLVFVETYLTQMRRANPQEDQALARAREKAAVEWEGTWQRQGENTDMWWSRVLDGAVDLGRLDEDGMFAQMAPRLWVPILDHRKELAP